MLLVIGYTCVIPVPDKLFSSNKGSSNYKNSNQWYSYQERETWQICCFLKNMFSHREKSSNVQLNSYYLHVEYVLFYLKHGKALRWIVDMRVVS